MKSFIIALLSFVTLYADLPPYQAKDFSPLLQTTTFDQNLLKMHFTLYAGYVKNTNLLLEKIKTVDPKSYEYGALKRRLGWEMDGMRLHELYFGNLRKMKRSLEPTLLENELIAQFGSLDVWEKDFVSSGLMRGIGWVILYRDPKEGRLLNMWINEHDVGHLAAGTPLLVMDVWEHAYMPQFGLDRDKYIQTFFENIDWQVVNNRYIETLQTKTK